MSSWISKLSLLALLLNAAKAADNGLALTPQMGWNTYEHFGCSYDADIILSSASALITNNLTSLGYEYVLVDDCWQAPARDPSTNAPIADPNKFPNGIEDVIDKVHAMGLKFGIYSDAGTFTCGNFFGSLGFEEIDAQTYASWGVDYLKYDNCYNEGRSGTPHISFERYNNMSLALKATGRPILYSLSNWGEDGPWNFASTFANSWRISGDVEDTFDGYDDRCPCTSVIDCKLPGYHCAVSRVIDFAAPVGSKAGPGKWNDMDMLLVGNGGMNFDEYVTQFSMWALLKSPLVLGTDITNMTNETLTIITNDAIIAVNQDSAGAAANRIWKRPVSSGGDVSLWQGSLANNVFVIALLNTSPDSQTVDILMSDAFRDQGPVYEAQPYNLFDLWQKDSTGQWGKPLGTVQGKIAGVQIGPHQTKVLRVVPA
ncbi:glycoside hydrolase family 27 protein [Ramaria rubella]|nr:glycoside hydrolase family 27 protein [Ramaria rubella]